MKMFRLNLVHMLLQHHGGMEVLMEKVFLVNFIINYFLGGVKVGTEAKGTGSINVIGSGVLIY
jgi:hypothetical protein